MIATIKSLFSSGDQQSREIKIHTLFNIFFRGLSVLCNYAIVPIALLYLQKSDYGVWLTLSSITAWLAFMDIGIGNGLKNKLSEAMAANDRILAKEYVSSAYLIFTVLVSGIFITFCLINFFLNWNAILNTDIDGKKLAITTYLVFFSFCCRLLLDLASIVVIALQKSYIKSLTDFLIGAISLLSIYGLTKLSSTSASSFVLFSSIVAIIPILVLLVFNYLFYYQSAFSYLRPNIKYFKRSHLKALFSLGIQFFIIQIAGLVIFSTDNILITQFFSTADVTLFNIAYKYFSVSTFAFSIIMLPYWSAFTNAYAKKEIAWIKSAFKKLIAIWLVQVFGVALLIMISGYVYRFWVGGNVRIPFILSISCGIYTIIFNWNTIFAFFINGVSKIRLQLYSAIVAGFINIPLSYFLIKYSGLGLPSIVAANCISLLISSIWSPIQCIKIISGTAKGIWNK